MSLDGTIWVPIGPSPMQESAQVDGLVTAIAVNPANTTSSTSARRGAAWAQS